MTGINNRIEEVKKILLDFAYGKYNTEKLNVEEQAKWKAKLICQLFPQPLDEALKEKLAWYILDEIAVKHSATHTGSGKQPCPICDRAEEAMRLLQKPTHEECAELYKKRRR